MSELPHVTIIVLNWNGRSYLDSCLTALSRLDYPRYSVVLVDNASSDDSVAFVQHRFPQVNIVQNRRNLGYAGGNNLALRNLQSEFAVLVNPDIVVNRQWLKELITPLTADQTMAIAGCKLYFPGGQLLQHAGGLISRPRAMPDHRGVREPDRGQYDSLCDVDYVTGAAIAIRHTALQTIGLLDEGYFMYFEEVDYCTRARAAAYRVVYVPQATAVHDESAIAVRGSYSYLERFHTGRWRYLLKHFEPHNIIAATFPAEEQWLANLQGDERQAVNRAYRTTLAGLDKIFSTRVADGGTEVNDKQQSSIAAGLQQLRRTAYDNPLNKQKLDELSEKADVQERPFSSTTPLIGPLLARIRALWAAVAVRESVSGITRQQNAFNEKLVQELREMESRLPLPTADWLQQDDNLGAVKQQQTEIDAELARAYQLIASIQSRLERLEKQADLNATSGKSDPDPT